MAQLKKLLFCRVFANVSGVYPKITINQSISQRLCSTTTTIDLDNNETFLKMRPAAENKMVREITRTRNADGSLTVEGRLKPVEGNKLVTDFQTGACALCSLGLEVKYTDVLILKQFMRKDGTLLPRRVTGVCGKQQRKLALLTHQAHNAGLFSDMRHYIGRERKPDKESTYKFKGLNRYFTDKY